ncbi:kinetochore-associated Ndc80 complex subunit spc24 [Gryganskiella cystojenkinii]|nr:kinetochore-associated Ndc80 complex subunit spc24 [Gryganskiella cystojenkinii]
MEEMSIHSESAAPTAPAVPSTLTHSLEQTATTTATTTPAPPEDLSTLIADIGSQFQRAGPDLQNIQESIHEVRETEKMRQEMLRDARVLLHKLSRALQLSKSKGSREHVDPESVDHDNKIVEMDKRKFAIAKDVQNMDQEIASLQAEVQELRMQSLELDSNYSQTATTTTTNGGGANNTGSRDEMDEGGSSSTAAAASSSATDSRQRRRVSRNEMSEMDEEMLTEEDEILSDRAHAMAVLRLQIYRSLGIEMLENDLGAYTKARVRSLDKNEVHLVQFDDKLSPFYQTNLIWEFAS